MRKKSPNKNFIPAPVNDEKCLCSECAFMKLNTLEKLYLCLKHELPEIKLSNHLINSSREPIKKMLSLT